MSQPPRTILLVEDNEMNRDMLSRRLEKRGYRVLLAGNGAEGIERVQEHRPDLVLMDMGLPVLDGWEATRRLKADPATRDVPVIGLTAHAMAGDRERVLEAGADDFDTKPVDLARLLEKIEALLAPPRLKAPVTLERPAQSEHLLALVDFARERCRALGAPDEVCRAVRLAVEEACTNVIEHGYRGAGPGPIAVSVETQGTRLVVTITDRAPTFDPAAIPAPDLTSDWRERQAGGLGWHFIRSVMDEVRHEPAGAQGNVLTLIKHMEG